MDKKVKDITVEILKAIRDEIRQLREDTNKRFEQMDRRLEQMDRRLEQMDRRFEQMDTRLGHIEADIKAIVAHFDRDYLLLANKMGEIEERLAAHISSHA